MTQQEQRIREFIREGTVAVPHVPDMADRVDRGLRRRRHRTIATGVGAAGLLLGIGIVVPNLLEGPDDTVVADPSARDISGTVTDPASDCTAMAITAIGATGDRKEEGSGELLLALTNEARTSETCAIAPGLRIKVSDGARTASVNVPDAFTPFVLRPGENAAVELLWSNWCSARTPRITIEFADGATTGLRLPAATELPGCTGPSDSPELTFARAQRAEVQRSAAPGK